MKHVAAVLLLLAASAASAQQYHLERDFDLLRNPASGNRPLQDVYWVSMPLAPWIDDVANTASPLGDKCVGDPGGPTDADGILNSDDLICSWWTARATPSTAGVFMLSRVDRETCSVRYRIGTVALGRIRFTGQPFELEQDIGYQVQVMVPPGAAYSPRNHAVLEGDDDPTWPGRDIVASPTCTGGQTVDCCPANAPRNDLVSCPYDALYRSSDEILCGLEGVDWMDSNRDGKPDTCWDDANQNGWFDAGDSTTGVFDGRVAMTVWTWHNDVVTNGPVGRTATIQLNSLRFTGTRFQLVPGDAYLLGLSKPHSPTLWLPPH